MECWLTPYSMSIKARLDENVLTTARASKFLDYLKLIFDTVIQTPALRVVDLKMDFDF